MNERMSDEENYDWLDKGNPCDVDMLDERIYIPITCEVEFGDVIMVEEHVCDRANTKGNLVWQLMAAYNVTTLVMTDVYGYTYTYRKAS